MVSVTEGKPDGDGFHIHEVKSPYQVGTTRIRVLLPEKSETEKNFPVVYVLPVEAGAESRYGDGLTEVKKLDLHNKLGAVFVAPTFSHLPWYADHPTRTDIRQETYILKVVVPFIDKTYPVRAKASGRLLLGFSKSGWGSYSLLLRHPEVFGKAAAWDAPLMMDKPGKYGSGDIFGTQENFECYRITTLLADKAEQFRKDKRLILLGYGNFRNDHQKAHELMDKLKVAHVYRDDPARKHDWHSGWVSEAVGLLLVEDISWVKVGEDGKGFVLDRSGRPFTPRGFNYDHDSRGRLIEDYWDNEWPVVEAHFAQMKKLRANVVRIHLQLGKFMAGPEQVNQKSLDRLSKLLGLAEREGLYLDLTGLGCYHKKDVPVWYDKLGESDRWDVQARFWAAVAGRCKDSPVVFCYDLMNEPVVPGGKRADGDWLGPAFGGKHFVQFVTLDQKDRARVDIAKKWIKHLLTAIRKVDQRHLVTVGLVDWSLDRKGLTSGFVPEKVAADLDFLSIHLYPESGKLDEALETLKGFSVGKPVVIEETFPLKCSPKELDVFMDRAIPHTNGWISFYWGTPPEELRRSKEIKDAILLDWLERFEKRAGALTK